MIFLKASAENWPAAVKPITHLIVRIFRFSNLIPANAMQLEHFQAKGKPVRRQEMRQHKEKESEA